MSVFLTFDSCQPLCIALNDFCFLLRSERTEIVEGVSRMICLLAVPATLNCHDLLRFVAPCHSTIWHIRIIRDGTPNQFMVLLE